MLAKLTPFLLTPLREGRHHKRALTPDNITISTHAPAGGATEPYQEPSAAIIISTHAPAGGATERAANKDRRGKFLLTPLREGRPASAVLVIWQQLISTHAPAGGATRVAFNHINI